MQVGVVLHALHYGVVPELRFHLDGTGRLEGQPDLERLLRACLHKEPGRRPAAADLLTWVNTVLRG